MFGKGRIRIEAHLWLKASRRAQELGYASLEDYVTHLLESQLRQAEAQTARERVLEKMKGLGYLQ